MNRELTYELDEEVKPANYDAAWRTWADSHDQTGQRIVILENQLKAERRETERIRIERDLANIRIKQFERMSATLTAKIDDLLAEIERLLRPTKRAA